MGALGAEGSLSGVAERGATGSVGAWVLRPTTREGVPVWLGLDLWTFDLVALVPSVVWELGVPAVPEGMSWAAVELVAGVAGVAGRLVAVGSVVGRPGFRRGGFAGVRVPSAGAVVTAEGEPAEAPGVTADR
ncbi:hypothetical protein [Streptomyces heilongjiangensis]|uniref:Uncharacterized protein n=1 Tax=Streptomyces heilongjiangensis TaxID=945052 RepID=A0ABW1BCD1_9ACTN